MTSAEPDTGRGWTLGIILAAGAGRRMGGPKALANPGFRDQLSTPLEQTCRWLHQAGCPQIVAVIGAQATLVRQSLPDLGWLEIVEATDWSRGMSASLAAGLDAAQHSTASAALISLVDLPDVGPQVYERVLAQAGPVGDAPASDSPSSHAPANHTPATHTLGSHALGSNTLARASYLGRPGHPVVIGRDWWAQAVDVAHGDHGAQRLFAENPHQLIDCSDLASGRDADTPQVIQHE